MLPATLVATLAAIVAVIALLLAVVAPHPLAAAVVVTIPLAEMIGTNGMPTALTAITTVATVILTAVTVTTIDVIATVLVIALAAPMTANVMARMTGRDVMMIGSVVRRTVRTAPTVRTGKVSCFGISPRKRSSHSHTAVPLDPMPSAHDELDTAE
jgi:hypothetical protein